MATDLTALAIEKAKPADARREIPDGKIRGLFLVVQPSGKKSWAFRYRRRPDGAPRKLTIGPWPEIDLGKARARASEARVAVEDGKDPADDKQVARRAAAVPNDRDRIDQVIKTFIERYAKANAPKTWEEMKRVLERELGAAWKGRRLSSITKADVHQLLDTIVDRGSPIMANRCFAYARRMGGWAVERGLIERSPFEGIKAPSAERSRDRILADLELKLVWKAAGDLGWPFGPLIQLLILTGQRRDEVGEMRWTELDLEARTWTLPKERAKNGVEHLVPLSPQAVAIIEKLPRITAPKGKPAFVFTSGGGTAVSGFSKAKSRIDKDLEKELGEPAAHWTLHDLRRTFASGCARLGVQLPVIEKILNHVSGSFAGIVGVYQRHSFADEKRAALELWGRHVEALVTPKPNNVVELQAVRS